MKITKRSLLPGLLFALTISLLAFAATGLTPSQERMPPRPHREVIEDPSRASVIVKFRADSGLRRALAGRSGRPLLMAPQHAAALATRLNMPLTDGRVLGPHTQVVRGQGMSSSQLATRLMGMSDVQWAVVDGRRYARSAPNDPYLGNDLGSVTPTVGQWYLRAPTELFLSAINALGAWSLSTGSSEVTVAVLDTGVVLDHPDLQGKLHPGYDFVSDELFSGDSSPRDDNASDPGDASSVGECGYYYAESSSWHGTQVSGIVGAATNNGRGIAGVGRDVMVLPVRVLGKCGGTDSDIIAGMRWAAGLTSDVGSSVPVVNDHPAKVLNLSLGSQGACSLAYEEVMQELATAGVTVVVAAGNDAGLEVDSPANCSGALAVAGLRHLGTKVGFSNVGPEVAIAAPGGNCVNTTGACLYPIMTTSNTGQTGPVAHSYSDSDNPSVGTSFAAPQVSGTIGLMLSFNPQLTPTEIRAALQATARTFPTSGAALDVAQCHAPNAAEQLECYCTTGTCGAGMLDAAAALAWVNPVPTARITVDTTALATSKSIVVSGTTSSAAGIRTLTGYQWTLLSGGQYARFSGSTTASSATVEFFGYTGSVEVQLRVTDSSGATRTATQTLASGSPPVLTSKSGGSMSAWWAVGLVFSSLLLWRQRRASRHAVF
jgi:serine protease